MNSTRKKLSILLPVALMLGCAGVSAPSASAQSIFASPQAAHAAGVGGYSSGGGAYRASDLRANDDPGSGGSGTTSGTDVYTGIFSQIQTATSSLLSGPGALAFGVLILGLGFGVAWRLVTKGVKSIAK